MCRLRSLLISLFFGGAAAGQPPALNTSVGQVVDFESPLPEGRFHGVLATVRGQSAIPIQLGANRIGVLIPELTAGDAPVQLTYQGAIYPLGKISVRSKTDRGAQLKNKTALEACRSEAFQDDGSILATTTPECDDRKRAAVQEPSLLSTPCSLTPQADPYSVVSQFANLSRRSRQEIQRCFHGRWFSRFRQRQESLRRQHKPGYLLRCASSHRIVTSSWRLTSGRSISPQRRPAQRTFLGRSVGLHPSKPISRGGSQMRLLRTGFKQYPAAMA